MADPWTEVSLLELLQALQEAEWGRPRGVAELLARFSLPRSAAQWGSRLKANVRDLTRKHMPIRRMDDRRLQCKW
jgi:hypothetical protein